MQYKYTTNTTINLFLLRCSGRHDGWGQCQEHGFKVSITNIITARTAAFLGQKNIKENLLHIFTLRLCNEVVLLRIRIGAQQFPGIGWDFMIQWDTDLVGVQDLFTCNACKQSTVSRIQWNIRLALRTVQNLLQKKLYIDRYICSPSSHCINNGLNIV